MTSEFRLGVVGRVSAKANLVPMPQKESTPTYLGRKLTKETGPRNQVEQRPQCYFYASRYEIFIEMKM